MLYDSGEGYPAMIPSTSNRTVGVLYEVPETVLNLLDDLEDYEEDGTNNLYNRVEQKIVSEKGTTLAYVNISNNDSLLKNEITNGDWKAYRLLLEK